MTKRTHRFVTAFLPSRENLIISWLHLASTVILEPKKIKSVTVFIVSQSIFHGGTGQHDLSFLNVEF